MSKNKTQIETEALLFIGGGSEKVPVIIIIVDNEETTLEDKKFGGKYFVKIKKEKNKYTLTPEYSNAPRYYEITDESAIEKIANATSFSSKIKKLFS